MTILKSRIEGDRFQRSLSLIETCWLPNTGFDWYEMASPELGVGLGVSGCLDGRSEGQLGNVCLRKVLISSCHSPGGRKGSIPGARVIPCLLYSISSLHLGGWPASSRCEISARVSPVAVWLSCVHPLMKSSWHVKVLTCQLLTCQQLTCQELYFFVV